MCVFVCNLLRLLNMYLSLQGAFVTSFTTTGLFCPVNMTDIDSIISEAQSELSDITKDIQSAVDNVSY